MAITLAAGAITEKFQAAGGAAKLGNPTANLTTLKDGRTTLQTFEQGAIFQNGAYGAFQASLPITAKWTSLASQTNAQGDSVQDYIGAAVGDVFTFTGGEGQYYERGMIVARSNGQAFVVYGSIYLRYRDLGGVTGFLGLPLSDEQPAANGGRCSLFDNGNIYWSGATDAHEIHGAILARWLAIGGPASGIGYPASDESSVMRNGVEVGRYNAFLNGSGIYWTAATGAFEVYGAIYALWAGSYGGPLGPLGFPISGETDTPDAGGRYNNFQNGIIVWHGSGPYAGAFAFGDLELFIQNFESDWNTVHVQVIITATNPASSYSNWIPSSSSYSDNPSVNNTVWSTPVLDNATTVSVFMDALGSHQSTVLGVTVQAGADETLGRFVLQYDITNLWGLLLQTPAGATTHPVNQNPDPPHHVNFNFQFKSTTVQEVIPPGAPWRSEYFWPFRNFSIAQLSKTQFAQTFSDVEEDPQWYSHPFDALFYDLVYKGLGNSGACFGVSLEALYAYFNRSVFSEPIFNNPVLQYPANLITGTTDPDPNVPADAVYTSPISIKFGYQVGAASIDYFLGEFVSGRTYNPKAAFQRALDFFNSGNLPVLSMTSNAFGGGGHTVLPYRFDAANWIIYLANPNDPFSAVPNDSDPSCMLAINAANNTFNFNNGEYSGGAGTGGRLFSTPFSVLNSEPRTPFWEVFALIVSGVFIVLAGDGETEQVTDGNGRTFYQYMPMLMPEPGHPPIPPAKSVVTDSTKLIPNMTYVPQLSMPANTVVSKGVANVGEVIVQASVSKPTEVYHLQRLPTFSKPVAPAAPPAAPATPAKATVTSAPATAVVSSIISGTILSVTDEDKDLQLSWEVTSSAGQQYSWGLRSSAGSVVATVPGAATSDVIQISSLARAGQAVTLTVSAGGAAKTAASLTLVGTILTDVTDARIFELTGVPMGVGSGITVQLDNGGQELVIQNAGSAANIGLRIQSGADAANSATRPAVTLGAGSVMKILPVDWTPANIAKSIVTVQHLDKVGGNVVSTSQI